LVTMKRISLEDTAKRVRHAVFFTSPAKGRDVKRSSSWRGGRSFGPLRGGSDLGEGAKLSGAVRARGATLYRS